MRTFSGLVALLAALLVTAPTADANGLYRFVADHIVGCGPQHGCGDACGCGCEAGCGCGSGCGCEVGCGCDTGCCEPACGCGTGCGVNGRQFAGQTWDGCCQSGPRLCGCVDECGNCCTGGCGNACGCGDACGCGAACGCEAGCGAEIGCGCDVGCGAEVSCGCAGGGCAPRHGKDWFGCGVLAAVGNCLCPCSGCNSEFYWSEWHNDPPRCQDPCDRCGNWVGPTGYRAPYDHEYAVNAAPGDMQYVGKAATNLPNRATAIAQQPAQPKSFQPTQRVAKRPYTGPHKNFQR